MIRVWSATLLALVFCPVHAAPARLFGSVGGWAYDITGTYTNTSSLDLEDDLKLKSTARADFSLGYAPEAFGWVPAIEFDYTRVAADGEQTFTLLPAGSALGALPGTSMTVKDRTSINDFELTSRWPLQLGSFTLLGGFTITSLHGDILVADESNGELRRQNIDETFPLVSAGVEWQPANALRFSVSGDYIQYQGNKSAEIEAQVLWKLLGPIGLEAGYRQRRYKIIETGNRLDAHVSGARVALVMEIPL